MNSRNRRINRRKHAQRKFFPNRLLAAQVGAGFLFFMIIARLFQLQVLHGESYAQRASAQRTGRILLPAQRGEILVRDSESGSLIKMATNTTLDKIAVDPKVTPDKRLVAENLAPLLYSDEDYEACLLEPKFCPEGSVIMDVPETQTDGETEEMILFPNESRVVLPTKAEATKAYEEVIFNKINQEKIEFITLARDIDDEKLSRIEAHRMPGISIVRETKLVYANPTEVPQGSRQRSRIAETLSNLTDVPADEIYEKLEEKDLRYVLLKNRVRPEVSQQIRELKKISRETHAESAKKIPDYYRGLVLQPDHWRYYPDGPIASHIIGFVNREGFGQYGIEGKFDRQLSGTSGFIESQNDVDGGNINPDNIQNAVDGVDLVLTIDRVVQRRVEEILAEATERFNADSGQVIVLEPDTGRIVALANYPMFDPNNFTEALLIRRTEPDDRENIYKTTPLFTKDKYGRLQNSTFEEFEEAWKIGFDPEFYVYRNNLGPGAFKNRTVQEIYEPGSVFKPLVMAAGIETGEVGPNTTFNEDGPIQIGEFTIKTALEEYNGIQTMTNVLETSSNVGMVRVAQKLGKSVMHNYITDKFGFGDFTDINLDQEVPGTVLPKVDWSTAHLLTSSFGQGLTSTPMQVARAWGALANGGILMQPQIISERIYDDGTVEEIEPEQVRRVLSADTATTITAMLVSAVNNGVATAAIIDGYSVAGKTGTSQIAGSDGRYETGEGSFITSFAGYAPAEDPAFVVLVKFDRPRYGTDRTWGSTTAAPVFKDVMSFLLDYADILPRE
jgi:cell division protein FtsI/penicillin-binding protein 2